MPVKHYPSISAAILTELVVDQVVFWDYVTLTSTLLDVQVVVAAYRYRFVFLVGCVIDPFVAVLVEVVAYRYRFVSLVGCLADYDKG